MEEIKNWLLFLSASVVKSVKAPDLESGDFVGSNPTRGTIYFFFATFN